MNQCVTFSDNKQASDRLMAGTNRQSSQGLQDEVGESIGTLSMVCDTGIISDILLRNPSSCDVILEFCNIIY